jgi:hypothetical protein
LAIIHFFSAFWQTSFVSPMQSRKQQDGSLRRFFAKLLIYRFSFFFFMIFSVGAFWCIHSYLDDVSPYTRRFLEDDGCASEGADCAPPSTLVVTANPKENNQEWLVAPYILGYYMCSLVLQLYAMSILFLR